MDTEFEIKFLNINEEDLREKLQQLNGKKTKDKKTMKRQTLDFPEGFVPQGQSKWARVRDEGDKITMTIKHIIDKSKIDGTKEVEIIVNDFESACNIFVETGLKKASYQENYREEWELDDCVLTIDTWPGLKPFLEIEGKSKEVVEELATKLGFDISQGMFGSIDLIYEKVLGISPEVIIKAPELTFENYEQVLKKS